MQATPLEEQYAQRPTGTTPDLRALLPTDIRGEVGQVIVYNLTDLLPTRREATPYTCRSFYRICLLSGDSRIQYADQTIDINAPSLLFATPKVPFYWLPQAPTQTGQLCIFTTEFLLPTKSGVRLDELPIFQISQRPVFPLSEAEYTQAEALFGQMQAELGSDYPYKYDLIRTYVLELVHVGQKRQSATALRPAQTAPARLTARFLELLEQQFPLESPQHQLRLRTANQFADRLSVHVNYLNKVLKDTTSLTTTDLIGGRVSDEAKLLLQQTNWTIGEIAASLGFADVATFSKFIRRQTTLAPGALRSRANSFESDIKHIDSD